MHDVHVPPQLFFCHTTFREQWMNDRKSILYFYNKLHDCLGYVVDKNIIECCFAFAENVIKAYLEFYK